MSEPIVLITGGAGNIGRTVTRAILASGARVAVPVYKTDRLDILDPIKREFGNRLLVFALDLTTERGADEAVKDVVEWAGRLDALVHLVGGYAGGMRVDATPVEVYDRMMDLNVKSAFLVGRAALRSMVPGGGGSVVFVSSRAATDNGAGHAVYAAAKSALLTFAEAVAEEYREDGVRVNVLLPSTVDTDANRAAMPRADYSAWTAPEAIAARIVALLSDEVTGQRIEV